MLAIGWEIGEWYTFIRHGTELDTAYEDTLGDRRSAPAGHPLAALIVAKVTSTTGNLPPVVVSLYVAVATRSFRRYSTYTAATLAGIFTNSVFGVIISFTYIAVWEQNPDAGGYDVTRRRHLRLAGPGDDHDRRDLEWRHHRRPRRADPHRGRRDRPLPAR